VLNIYATS